MVQSTDGNPLRVGLRVEEVLRGEDRGPTVQHGGLAGTSRVLRHLEAVQNRISCQMLSRTLPKKE